MIMEEKPLSEKESFDIIYQMIGNARNNITDNGFGWLLWGSMIFLAAMSTFIFIQTGYKNIYIGWNIFGIISLILLAYNIARPKKKGLVRTYVDDLLRLFDIGFAFFLFTIIFSINAGAVAPAGGFAYFLMIYAFLMLIQGGALKFVPLTVGAVVNWLGAIAIFILKDFKYAMLITAAAVLAGYILPGIILWKKYNNKKMDKNPLSPQHGI